MNWGPRTPLFQLLILVAVGVLLWGLIPAPEAVQPRGWGVLFLFLMTIVGVLWNPYPIGVVVIISLAAGLMCNLITVAQALDGFSSSVTWIIVAAFLFARAFVKTGLGRRIALVFIEKLGTSSLKLGYALALSDLVLAPVTASNTARTGGIIFPIARSLAHEFDSRPGGTEGRIGTYLLFTAYQSNVITSALFLTAMAANGLTVQLARDTVGAQISWGLWFMAASLPGFLSLGVMPLVIHRLNPPELKRTPEARLYAKRELAKLGPIRADERILAIVFAVLALTWATSSLHSIGTLATALGAVAVLLITGVLTWEDVIGESSAWGTLVWFGGFVSLAGALNESGAIQWFAGEAERLFQGWDGLSVLVVLLVIYLYLHYAFASMTSQIVALYAAFVATAVAAGAPSLLAALVFCFFSNLYASLTHYGDGAAPIYYGSGYISVASWWRSGFVISLLNLAIWLGLGLLWWKELGIW